MQVRSFDNESPAPSIQGVLLLDCAADECHFVRQRLKYLNHLSLVYRNVHTLESVKAALDEGCFDVLLVNPLVVELYPSELMKQLTQTFPELPVVVIEPPGEQLGAQFWRAYGAQDVLSCEQLNPALMERTLVHAIECKALQTQLRLAKTMDDATGLMRRSAFLERLEAIKLRYPDTHQALVLFDFALAVGADGELTETQVDSLLAQSADLILMNMETGEHLARYNQRQLIALVNGKQGYCALDERFTRLQADLEQLELALDGPGWSQVTIGVAMTVEGESTDTWITHTELALRHGATQNRPEFFTAELHRQISYEQHLEQALRQAVRDQAFTLHYQPQIDLETRQIAGAEALLRWQHPELGDIGPDKFVPMLEQLGLIAEVTEWVIRTACNDWFDWQMALLVPRDSSVSVNISPLLLKRRDLVAYVTNALDTSGLPAECLELEVTENLFLDACEVCMEVMKSIRSLGVTVALDDFGTGYSSLSYLKTFPLGRIKLDRTFVRDLAKSPVDLSITRAILQLADALNFKVIAEGVEDRAGLDLLRRFECKLFQGFYFSRPLKPTDFVDYCRQFEGNAAY